MNPDAPKNLRAELETRLTALLLGELSADDAELLRKLIAHDPELRKLHDQLKLTVELVGETARGAAEAKAESAAPLKLSSERREKLLARFKTVQPKEFARPAKRFSLARVAVAVAAVLVFASLLSALFLPSLARSKAKASRANFSRNSWTASPALGGGLEERQPRSTAGQRSADQELALRMTTAAEHAQMKEQSTTAETLKNASPAAPPVVHQPDNNRSPIRRRRCERLHNSVRGTDARRLCLLDRRHSPIKRGSAASGCNTGNTSARTANSRRRGRNRAGEQGRGLQPG